MNRGKQRLPLLNIQNNTKCENISTLKSTKSVDQNNITISNIFPINNDDNTNPLNTKVTNFNIDIQR